MKKMTVATIAFALSVGTVFAQGGFGQQQPGQGGQGGFGGGFGGMGQQQGGRQRQGQQGGQQGQRRQRQGQQGGQQGGFGGGMGGFGGGMMPGMGAGGMGGFGGGMGGFGGGMGGMGGFNMNGQLDRYINTLKANTPREEAEAKIAAKYKDDYEKIIKSIDEANKKLADLAKKAEVTLPNTSEQNSAKIKAFLNSKKADIDKLLETDKTNSRQAMQDFRALAQKEGVELNAAFGMGMGMGMAMPGQPGGNRNGGAFGNRQPGQQGGAAGGRQPGQAGAGRGNNTNLLNQLKEKFPTEYEAAEKLRESDPSKYREAIRELRQKLNSAN